MKYQKNILSAVVAILVGAGGATHVLAQADDKLVSESERLIEELLVVGTAASDRNSTELKRNADHIMDVMAADELGALPDLNVAEVFERISGISTTTSNGDDEGKFILIRGLESNTSTIDGMAIASGSSSRQTSLESIPSGAIVRAEVNKSMSAKNEGQGLGGSINMGTRSAFSTDGMFLRLDLEGTQYSEDRGPLGDVEATPLYAVTFSNTFGADDQFGLVVALQADERSKEIIKHFREYDWDDSYDGNLYAYTSKKPWAEDRTTDYDRKGGLVKFEYQTDDYYTFLSGFYFDKNEDILATRWELNGKGDKTFLEPGHAIVEKGEAKIQDRNESQERKNARLHFHFDTVINEIHAVNIDISHGKAERDKDDVKWEFKAKDADGNNQLTQLGYEVFSIDRGSNWVINDREFFENPENYKLDKYEAGPELRENEINEVKVDWSFNLDHGDNLFGFGAGLKYRNDIWERNKDKVQFEPIDSMTLAQFVGDYGYLPDGFSGYVEPHGDRQKFLDFYGSNPDLFVSKYSDNTQFHEDQRNDYIFDEEISSVYVMASYQTSKWTLSGGLRYEHTAMDSTAWVGEQDKSTGLRDYHQLNNSASYGNVLPSINFAYHITEDLLVRMAASKSIMRPNPDDTSARTEVEFYELDDVQTNDDLGDFLVKVKRKNSKLEPQESVNTEISLEYYFSGGLLGDGMASVTVFNKDIIQAPIGITSLVENDADYNGLNVLYEEKTSDSDREIQGYELGLKMGGFSFLPAALQGLGMSANLTWLDGTEGWTDWRGDTVDYSDLKNQPDRMANARIYYSFMEGRGEVVLAYKYKGYTRIGRNDSQPYKSEFWAPREFIDLQVKYSVTDQLGVNLDIKNIREEATYRMQGYDHELLRHDNQFGRAVTLGMSYQF